MKETDGLWIMVMVLMCGITAGFIFLEHRITKLEKSLDGAIAAMLASGAAMSSTE